MLESIVQCLRLGTGTDRSGVTRSRCSVIKCRNRSLSVRMPHAVFFILLMTACICSPLCSPWSAVPKPQVSIHAVTCFSRLWDDAGVKKLVPKEILVYLYLCPCNLDVFWWHWSLMLNCFMYIRICLVKVWKFRFNHDCFLNKGVIFWSSYWSLLECCEWGFQ